MNSQSGPCLFHCLVGACLLLSIGAPSALGAESADSIWTLTTLEKHSPNPETSGHLQLKRFQGAELRPSVLDAILAQAPMEDSDAAKGLPTELSIPMPDGGFERFVVVESPVMHPELQRWLEEQGRPIRTYLGRSLDRPGTTVRLDWGASGFHAMVYGPGDDYFVDPHFDRGANVYASYFKRDRPGTPVSCGVDELHSSAFNPLKVEQDRGSTVSRDGLSEGASTEGELRTYRAAFAMTGDYTIRYAFGDVSLAQSQLVTMINRLNLVFERDLSMRLVLIADNHELIFADPATDPYTESQPFIMLTENQIYLDGAVGQGNYDIGHVIYHGASGVATGDGICTPFQAGGVSGLVEQADNPVALDMVAHEVGHQFNASHTFNSDNFVCIGPREDSTAYEPGSGSTFMSYTGVCGLDNLATTSDHYFHAVNLDQILAFVENGSAGLCDVGVSTGNDHAPTVIAMDDRTIPMGTPFELNVLSSEDLDGDTLTYVWEQIDLGVAAALAQGDLGSGPIIRSLPPSMESTRRVMGNMFGEILPTTDRDLNFRVTVRDNHMGGGRIGHDTVTVTSVTSAGPFRVTSPNGGEILDPGSLQTVTWDVASTDGGAVNTPNVDIFLSIDGGRTFPHLLLEGTPNDGSEAVSLPWISTSTAQIRVRGSEQIFFDTSDNDFSIGASVWCASPNLALGTVNNAVVFDEMNVFYGEEITDLNVSLDISHQFISDLIVTLEHVDTGFSVRLLDRPGTTSFFSFLGCMEDHVNAVLDDEAPAAAENQCSIPIAIDGTFSPYDSLSVFDGRSLIGTWRLSVETYFSSGGTVNQWCLKAEGPSPDPNVIFADGFESGGTSEWSLE